MTRPQSPRKDFCHLGLEGLGQVTEPPEASISSFCKKELLGLSLQQLCFVIYGKLLSKCLAQR